MRQRKSRRPPSPRLGWRVPDFAAAVGLGESTVWMKIKKGEIETALIGRARIIREDPADYIARHTVSTEL